jgi:hypothetical protein
MPYGLVKPMLEPQREINKRRSKALHAMNTERTVYEEGAVDSEDTLKRELARPDGIIKKNRGFEIDFQSNREITQSQLQFYEASNAELDAVTGITPDLLGMQTNARNATALMQRTRQSLSVLNRIFENWKRTRIYLEELKLLFMQEFWTNEKVIRVTDDQNIVRIVPLNRSIKGPRGEELKIHDIRAGKYDIVIDEADESINRMQEMFSELTKLAQTGQIPPELVFEFAPVPKALRDRLLGKLQESQMQQQQMMAQQAQLAAAQGETGQSEQPQAAPGQ